MNPRDEQISAIRQSTTNLRQDRLEDCYTLIREAYEAESIIDHVAQVSEEHDRTPSDFHVLSNSETRPLSQFNDDTYHWDHYCRQLGRSIAIGEQRYFFEELQRVPVAGKPIDAGSPQFDRILSAIRQLASEGYDPDVLCAPNSLFVLFMKEYGMHIDWNSTPRGLLKLPGGPSLPIYWSNGLAPLDRFVVLDSTKTLWRVKLDPITAHRLTVVIGEPSTQIHTVRFLAETVAKHEILDPAAIHSILVEGEPKSEGS